MRIFLTFLGIAFSFSCYASSVRLINDSPNQLRAVIRGADGSYLGEMVINPQNSSTWTDTYGQSGSFGQGNAYEERSTRSQTPYTVIWRCLDGGDYSICTNVSTGGTVTAQGCDGNRYCKPPKKTPPSSHPNEPEELIETPDQSSE